MSDKKENTACDESTGEVKNIYQRLIDARSEFHSQPLVKSGRNDFSGYDYFELSDILRPGLEALKNNGLCALPITAFGAEIIMRVVCVETKEEIEFRMPLGSAKLKATHDIQNKGAVMTYSRRYLWMQLLEVVEGDPLEGSEVLETHRPTDPATDKQLETLRKAYKDGSMSEAAKANIDKITSSGKKITIEQASGFIGGLAFENEEKLRGDK